MDISLLNGDLELKPADADGNYDLVLDHNTTAHLVKRALETPLSYLGRTILTATGTNNIDTTFGNALYQKLSEPFTLNWLSEANQDVRNALDFIRELIEIKDISFYTNANANSISIRLTYADASGSGVIEVPLT